VEAEEQFSDGVGMDRSVKSLLCFASYRQLAGQLAEFPYNPPTTKESLLYRYFHSTITEMSAAQTVRKWIPRWRNEDPSGGAHTAHVGTANMHK
jgi:asparagine synthase (glutamine-hydrolysing)